VPKLRAFPRALAALTSAALIAAGFLAVSPAYADTAPEAGVLDTVSTDPLPTAQIDGVAWSQVIVGNTVYVGGDFGTARPAGAAAGTQTVPRYNLLAYNLTTGALISGFAPNVNAPIKSVSASPDNKTLYIGGSFTLVDGAKRYRVAAFDISGGPAAAKLTAFAPLVGGAVEVVKAAGSTLWVGGNFTYIGSADRVRIAALNAANGAVLPFNAVADGGRVRGIAVSPDGSKIVVGGSFTTLNGSDNPGYGLGALDAATGALVPWAANGQVRNGGANAAVYSLTSDADGVYGTGYVFGSGGNAEGAFRMNWSDGSLYWYADCHGDVYSAAVSSDVVYVAGHSHYCYNIGGYPQTEPTWHFQRGLALTKDWNGNTNLGQTLGYASWEGVNAPDLLNWYPDFNVGTKTGSNQGPWTVAANDDYVLYGGEFTTVNSTKQQGLVRFATKAIAPNTDGPRMTGTSFIPTANSYSSGEVRLSWIANYDRDNQYLTYNLIRDGKQSTPIYTTVQGSRVWYDRPAMGYVDTGLQPGSIHTYRLKATDPYGNVAWGDTISVTVSSTPLSDYASAVIDDGATSFWRLGDPAGSTTVGDWAGSDAASAGTGVTFGQSGAILGDANTSALFSGSSTGLVATQTPVEGSNNFTVEAWFNTTSTTGGKIVGFGNSNTGLSGSYDRHVYMDANGRVMFGVYPGFSATLQSATGYNDGQWHQVTASLSPTGMQLYIDGVRVGQRTDVTSGQAYSGYWRIGGDNSWSGDQYFDGQIDDVALYTGALTRDQVRTHYTASGRTIPGPAVPTDTYGALIYNAQPDLYWRLDDSASSTTVTDYSGNANNGTYANGVSKPVDGALAGNSDTAASFDGADDTVYSNQRFSNPTTYSLELWFNSNSTSGGKLIGFGGSQTGNSSSHDRDVFLQSDGRIAFGAWTGNTNLVTTPGTYNDGKWHQVTATQSSAGMRLYVDGALVGQNGNTGAENSANYWRVGGDTVWQGVNSYYLKTTIDEVAVYGYALSASDVQSHFNAALPANALPTASFSSTTRDRTATFDATSSSDSDGTIASYDWTFGDGATGTGPTPTHTFDAAGDYSVKVTVTDNRGGTASITHLLTVSAPAAPTDAYGAAVTADDPALYWRLDESPATTIAADASGAGNSGTYRGNVTKPVTGTLADGTGSAAHFTGSDNWISSTQRVDNPTTYALEAWFKTTSTTGGKIIGFGDNPDGLSNNYDRHVYLQDDGKLVFGTYAGELKTITSPNSYNDNTWHQVVAEQSSAGQKLYVDGQLVGSTTETGAQSYSGYWKVGGDWTWGSSSPWYSGDIDEVAVYNHVLSDADVLNHFRLGSTVAPANQIPTADFSSTTDGFGVSVDGTASADPDGTIASYSWSFGDGGTATGKTAGHAYLGAGDYNVTLTVTDDDGATAQVTKTVSIAQPNSAPTAAFTSATNDLSVSVDGSSSVDSDGTLSSYAWTFGDGGTASGATAGHTYSTGGTYTVTLTVTDDDGSTAVATHAVTVAAPNSAPTAAFTATATDLGVSTDGRTSSDSDGTISSYAWAFGDGESATGATAAHTYGAAGTYDVTLTVTDDDGATNSVTRSVTVTAPPVSADLARDAFGRTTTNGLGSAETGGAWTTSGTASRFAVSGGTGNITATAGSTMTATLNSVSSTDTEVQVTASIPAAVTGGSHYISVIGRRVGGDDYRARMVINTAGAVNLQLQRSGTTLSAGTVTGLTYQPGDQLRVRLQVTGTSPTTIRVKVWKVGTTEPISWRLETTDNQSALQVKGGIGIGAYLNASASAPIVTRFDDLWAGPTSGSPAQPTNAAPTAAFTSTASGLTASVDASSSTDSDGTIAQYAWNFGDGATANTATASHPYASGGTYPVTLTITDDDGATATTTKQVTVTAPAANAAPTAAFTGTATGLSVNVDGTGSTDADGTVAAFSWNFGDGGTANTATASHSYATAGTYTVKLTVTDDKGATATVSQPVTVTATTTPTAPVLASDDFNRATSTGWATAAAGGQWSGTGATFATDGTGAITSTKVGQTFDTALAGVSSTASRSAVTVTFDAVGGGSRYASVIGRKVGADSYRARVVVNSSGKVNLQLLSSGTTLANVSTGLTYAVGDQLRVVLDVTGTSPTTLSAKVWKVGTTEPTAWTVTATDALAALQAAGAVGLGSYVGTGVAPLPAVVRFDDYLVTSVQR